MKKNRNEGNDFIADVSSLLPTTQDVLKYAKEYSIENFPEGSTEQIHCMSDFHEGAEWMRKKLLERQ